MSKETLSFIFPLSGDCVTSREGEITVDGKLILNVSVAAPSARKISVAGVPAAEANGVYTASVVLSGGVNSLVATDEMTGETVETKVIYLADAAWKYRISSDDNLWFLRDVSEHPELYPSIFDHPYMKVYKTAHDLYGAKVQLNLFYATDDLALSKRANPGNYFDLSMMTDRYKDEFIKNADWLQLTFHASTEYPSKPYQFEKAEVIRRDCEMIHREICRFAGKECISDCVTVHWGEASPECIQELRRHGYRSFMGYFMYHNEHEPLVCYNATNEFIDHMAERDFFYEESEDVLYGHIDLVLNLNTAEENLQTVKAITEHNGKGGFVSLMIHEQYFYEDYKHYLPDFAERVLGPCNLLAELGYTGCFVADATKEVEFKS